MNLLFVARLREINGVYIEFNWSSLYSNLKAKVEYRLPGYSLFLQDRAGRAKGDVMLYVNHPLNPVQIPIVTPFEIVGAEVRGSEPKVQVFVRHRPKALFGCWPRSLRISFGLGLAEDCLGFDWETDVAVGKDYVSLISSMIISSPNRYGSQKEKRTC